MRQPTTTTLITRAELLRHAERLRRAAQLLEAHARRVVVEQTPAHGEALNVARGMVRAVVDTRVGEGVE